MRDRVSGMEGRQGSCHNPCLNPAVQVMKAAAMMDEEPWKWHSSF